MTSNAQETFARARAAQTSWSQLSAQDRCRAIKPMRRQIARECEDIASLIARDAHKPQLDALSGDVLVTLEQIRYYERSAANILRDRKVRKTSLFFSGAIFHKFYEPYGAVLIIGPSNYPLQLALIPAITALIAGNAVVLKCSELCPGTAQLIAHLCEKHLPRNLVQVFQGDGKQSEALIDAHPDLIFFTGSSRNGQQVARRAAELLVPLVLELGGKDPAVVFADCNLDRSVEGIVYGAFSNAGRVCVATKRLYVEEAIYSRYLGRLIARIRSLRVGNGGDDDLCALPAVHLAEFRAQVQDALSRGAKLHHPENPSEIGVAPVLLSDVPSDASILTSECFGPALCVASFRSEAESIELANRSAFALSGSVWTSNRRRGRRIAAQLAAGSCAINDVIRNIANPYAPFGGNRRSGYGRYHGPEGLLTFSRVKTVMQARDRHKRERNWFPFHPRTFRQLSALIRIRHAAWWLPAKMLRLLPALVFGLLAVASAQQTAETHLAIEVDVAPEAHGQLAYLIFNSPQGFPGDRDKAFRRGFVPIPQKDNKLKIDATLPPGTYAVTVYEDLNSNGKLDHNLLGIPREPVGASNNPRPRLGPPRFNECSFRLGASSQTISIHLVKGL